MAHETYEFRFTETKDPSGQISLAELAAVANQLQELATRVSRWTLEIDRPGRSPGVLEEIAHLRLSGLRSGSTVLEITRGDPQTLDIEESVERTLDDNFWSVLDGIAHDSPPVGAPSGVRESARGLIEAFDRAGGHVHIARRRGDTATFRPAERNRDIWVPEQDRPTSEVTVHGLLEVVDLRSRGLRVCDDVGNRIPLTEVHDAEHVASLIGQRVTAVGYRSELHRNFTLRDVVVRVADAVPVEWAEPERDSWVSAFERPGPDPDAGLDLDDDEWATFTTALAEQ